MAKLWTIYALLSAIFAALVTIFAKEGFQANAIDSTIATTIRSVIMATFLILFSIFTAKTNLVGSISLNGLMFIGLSAISGALSWLFYFFAIENAPSENIPAVVALDRFSILFVFIFTILFFWRKNYLQFNNRSNFDSFRDFINDKIVHTIYLKFL